jgi:2-dehydro-3-deoxy-D-arabinonate dehydratase
MQLLHHQTPAGPRWSLDGQLLPIDFSIGQLLQQPAAGFQGYLAQIRSADPVTAGSLLAPVEPAHEVWAAGVTYLRSREAREAESATGDIYQRIYAASRPELFFKSPGWRVVAPGDAIRVRQDSRWNVPEPELTLVINRQGDIVGYTAGNDVSSRDIEGENPLYLPQAKVYNRSCALGPAIHLIHTPDELRSIPIRLKIRRAGDVVFQGETHTGLMKRTFEDLAAYLFRELDFPRGAFLMTGTGIVPPESFSLLPGDEVQISVGAIILTNPVSA